MGILSVFSETMEEAQLDIVEKTSFSNIRLTKISNQTEFQ